MKIFKYFFSVSRVKYFVVLLLVFIAQKIWKEWGNLYFIIMYRVDQ